LSATRILIAIGALLVLGAVNFSILGKERIKRAGEVIYLDLAPVDPRSLMQGDYMTLRFRLADQIQATLHKPGQDEGPREGEQRFADIVLDPRGVASLARPGAPATHRLRYRIRRDAVWLGTNAFFFEEGSDKRYAGARFGEFRLDRESGEAVLVGLRDARLQPL
jgi:uncharacterized membrane-anchored protein